MMTKFKFEGFDFLFKTGFKNKEYKCVFSLEVDSGTQNFGHPGK